MDMIKFNKLLKEHYVEPQNEMYRDLYRKKFNEEPPDNVTVMMDKLIDHGNEQMREILQIIQSR